MSLASIILIIILYQSIGLLLIYLNGEKEMNPIAIPIFVLAWPLVFIGRWLRIF
jgi:hypothetical protein